MTGTDLIVVFEIAPRKVGVLNVTQGGAEIVTLPNSAEPTGDDAARVQQQSGKGAVWVENPTQHPHPQVRDSHQILRDYVDQGAVSLCTNCVLANVCAVRIATEGITGDVLIGRCSEHEPST